MLISEEEVRAKISRIAEFEQESISLLIERARLAEWMSVMHDRAVLDLADGYSPEIVLQAAVMERLRADDEYAGVFRQLSDLDARRHAAITAAEKLRWELALVFVVKAESVFPVGAMLKWFPGRNGNVT